jgi:hypothetical protein
VRSGLVEKREKGRGSEVAGFGPAVGRRRLAVPGGVGGHQRWRTEEGWAAAQLKVQNLETVQS